MSIAVMSEHTLKVVACNDVNQLWPVQAQVQWQHCLVSVFSVSLLQFYF